MIYYVYILECESGKYYTGYTADIHKRIKQHVSGKGGAKFTRGFRPLNLSAVWKISGNKGDAMKIEAFIKTLTRSDKEVIIREPSILNRMIAEKYPDRGIGVEMLTGPLSPRGGTEKEHFSK